MLASVSFRVERDLSEIVDLLVVIVDYIYTCAFRLKIKQNLLVWESVEAQEALE